MARDETNRRALAQTDRQVKDSLRQGFHGNVVIQHKVQDGVIQKSDVIPVPKTPSFGRDGIRVSSAIE